MSLGQGPRLGFEWAPGVIVRPVALKSHFEVTQGSKLDMISALFPLQLSIEIFSVLFIWLLANFLGSQIHE